MPKLLRPQYERRVSNVPKVHPLAAGMMSSLLGLLAWEDLGGGSGEIRYGYPAIGTLSKFGGYVNPPQLFLGYNPLLVAGGAIRPTPGGLPGTQPPVGPVTPLLAATMQVTAMSQTSSNILGATQ